MSLRRLRQVPFVFSASTWLFFDLVSIWMFFKKKTLFESTVL